MVSIKVINVLHIEKELHIDNNDTVNCLRPVVEQCWVLMMRHDFIRWSIIGVKLHWKWSIIVIKVKKLLTTSEFFVDERDDWLKFDKKLKKYCQVC